MNEKERQTLKRTDEQKLRNGAKKNPEKSK